MEIDENEVCNTARSRKSTSFSCEAYLTVYWVFSRPFRCVLQDFLFPSPGHNTEIFTLIANINKKLVDFDVLELLGMDQSHYRRLSRIKGRTEGGKREEGGREIAIDGGGGARNPISLYALFSLALRLSLHHERHGSGSGGGAALGMIDSDSSGAEEIPRHSSQKQVKS